MILLISHQTNFTKFEHNNVDQRDSKNFQNKILQILAYNRSF